MPAASSIRALVGYGSPLRSTRALLPVTSRAMSDRLANGMFGGRVTAAADAEHARIRLELYWPGIRVAQVVRVHADGTTYPVRDGEPAMMLHAWAAWDWEAPLDAPVAYQATALERTGALCTSAPITLPSLDRDWLKHPTRPELNRRISIREFGDRSRPARSARIHPPTAPRPITVHGVRQDPIGQILVQTDGTVEDIASLQALLDDNADLLVQRPAVRGGQSWWISIDTTGDSRIDPGHPTLLIERTGLPFEVTDRAPGEAEGVAGGQFGDLGVDFATINQLNAAYSSYLDLSMRAS